MRLALPCLALTLLASTARAEPSDDKPVEPPPVFWTLGAGLGTGNLLATSAAATTGTTSGLASLSALTPAAQVGVERRLTGNVWLLMQARATHSRYTTPETTQTAPGITTGQEGSSTYTDLALGIRQRFPVGPQVRLSWYAAARGSYALNEPHQISATEQNGTSISVDTVTRATTVGLGASVGFAADVMLMDALALRVGTSVIDFTYRTTTEQTVTTVKGERTTSPNTTRWQFDGGLSLAPALALQVMF